MLKPFYKFFKNREGRYSYVWYKIAITRFVLCGAIFVSLLFDPSVTSVPALILATGLYLAILIFGFGPVSPHYLRKKRIRIIPAFLDILFTSILIYFTGGQNSSWFLLYVFPIFSVSRYMGNDGSILLSIFAILAYGSLVIVPVCFRLVTQTGSVLEPEISLYQLVFKCLVLFCIGLVAGNLTKPRRIDDDDPNKDYDLIDIFRKIDNESLSSAEIDKVSERIIEKVVRFLNCDFGEIRIYDDKRREVKRKFFDNVVHKIIDDKRGIFNNSHFERVFKSERKETILELGRMKPFIKKGAGRRIFLWVIKFLNKYPSLADVVGSIRARFFYVPIILKGEIVAIIALYFDRRIRHLQLDRLDNFAPLIAFALDKAKLFEEKAKSDKEKKGRLETLYAIGAELGIGNGLNELFENIVELTYNQLNSEEAAIFVLDDKDSNLLVKKKVWGPTKEISKKLLSIENEYKKNQSLVGRIFVDKKPELLEKVDPSVKYYKEYAERLPSGKVRHYIGVPLIIDGETLGVIRIINKRAPAYSVEKDVFELSEKGFDNDDRDLMQMIASQVAAAIRSAKFIEVQEYYEKLVVNSPDPIIVIDAKGFVTLFNKACEEVWGFMEEEVLGTHVTAYYASEDEARNIGKLLSESGQLHDYATSIKGKNGEIVPINLSASNLDDRNGDKIGSIGVFKDQRETIRLQEEKGTAERLATLNKFGNVVGHQIKTDLASALLYINALTSEFSKPRSEEEVKGVHQKIKGAITDALSKIKNTLVVGNPKNPKKILIGTKEFTQRLEGSTRPTAESAGIEFTVIPSGADYLLEVDIEQLKQVFFNLVHNSIDAIRKKEYTAGKTPRIVFSTNVGDGNLHINWEDNGSGIPAKNIESIFTPFVTYKESGNGLGLFLVKDIIENHKGRISVESQEGVNAVFIIEIPLSTGTKRTT